MLSRGIIWLSRFFHTYTYDANGNILSVSDGTHTTTYVYDAANQLVRENNQAGGFTHVWTYDDAGNILSRTEYAYTTGTLGTATDAVAYTYGDSSWGDLLTAYDGVAISHDTIGNPLTDGTWTYTWEHGRELAAMTDGSTTWNFQYGADGMRTSRSNGTKTYSYVYNGGTLSQMKVGSDTLNFTYDASGRALSVSLNGTTYYYATNLQGDVTAILNASGTAVVNYTYDAWGSPLTTTGTLRYRGYVYGQETGLYYLQSRYYDSEVGRFINADVYTSTGQGLLGNNMFAYCLNNPIKYNDPTGTRVYIWKVMFENHKPGFLHQLVQAHIISSGLFSKELYLPGVGRADIIDPETGELWEIKHDGSTDAMIAARTRDAADQVGRYVKYKSIVYMKGHEGAFTGSFVVNYNGVSYCVEYNTPEPGVILYFVQEKQKYEKKCNVCM